MVGVNIHYDTIYKTIYREERTCCKTGKWRDGTGVPKKEAGK